jgi:general stress protein YciG
MANTSKRGFASMDSAKQREIASKGGRAAHAKGTAHEFTSDEARVAGRKGGEAVSRDRQHMSAIGREGGHSRGARARANAQDNGNGNGSSNTASSRNDQPFERQSQSDRGLDSASRNSDQNSRNNTSSQNRRESTGDNREHPFAGRDEV